MYTVVNLLRFVLLYMLNVLIYTYLNVYCTKGGLTAGGGGTFAALIILVISSLAPHYKDLFSSRHSVHFSETVSRNGVELRR
jgi:hypothetical protein